MVSSLSTNVKLAQLNELGPISLKGTYGITCCQYSNVYTIIVFMVNGDQYLNGK